MPREAVLLEAIGASLLGEREALAEEMAARIRDAVTEFAELDGPELREAIRVSCLANLETGLAALTRELELPAEIPPDARDLALLAARLDLPLAALLRTYRVGQAMMWRRLFEAVDAGRPRAHGDLPAADDRGAPRPSRHCAPGRARDGAAPARGREPPPRVSDRGPYRSPTPHSMPRQHEFVSVAQIPSVDCSKPPIKSAPGADSVGPWRGW